jgi:hypothetical protein
MCFLSAFLSDDEPTTRPFEHSGRFEALDLPILRDDLSQFDVHCKLKDNKVKQVEYI